MHTSYLPILYHSQGLVLIPSLGEQDLNTKLSMYVGRKAVRYGKIS